MRDFHKLDIDIDVEFFKDINNILKEYYYGDLTPEGIVRVLRLVKQFGVDEFKRCLILALEKSLDDKDVLNYTHGILVNSEKQKLNLYLYEFNYIKKVLTDRFKPLCEYDLDMLKKCILNGLDKDFIEKYKKLSTKCDDCNEFIESMVDEHIKLINSKVM